MRDWQKNRVSFNSTSTTRNLRKTTCILRKRFVANFWDGWHERHDFQGWENIENEDIYCCTERHENPGRRRLYMHKICGLSYTFEHEVRGTLGTVSEAKVYLLSWDNIHIYQRRDVVRLHSINFLRENYIQLFINSMYFYYSIGSFIYHRWPLQMPLHIKFKHLQKYLPKSCHCFFNHLSYFFST